MNPRYFFLHFLTTVYLLITTSCNIRTSQSEANPPRLKEETVSYSIDSLTMNSYVVYDENKKGKRRPVYH